MIKRRRLGPVYERSPAQKVRDWFLENIGRVIFTFIAWAIWIGVYYVILGVVNFLAVNMGIREEDYSPGEMMRGGFSRIVLLAGMLALTVYILRDPMKRKKKG